MLIIKASGFVKMESDQAGVTLMKEKAKVAAQSIESACYFHTYVRIYPTS